MQHLICRIWLGVLFFLSSVNLYSQKVIQESSSYHIEYDQWGNPIKVCINVTQIVTPIVDGMLLHAEQECHTYKQEFGIDCHKIEELPKDSILEIKQPKIKSSVAGYLSSSNFNDVRQMQLIII